MEKLDAYLKAKRGDGLLKKEFAEKIGITNVHLSNILAGRRLPSYGLMAKIERATGRKVKIGDWIDFQSKRAEAQQPPRSENG